MVPARQPNLTPKLEIRKVLFEASKSNADHVFEIRYVFRWYDEDVLTMYWLLKRSSTFLLVWPCRVDLFGLKSGESSGSTGEYFKKTYFCLDSQRRRVAWGLCRKTTSQWSEALRERSFHFLSVLLNIVKPRYKLSTSGTRSTVPFEGCCKTTSQWSLAIRYVRSVLLVKIFNIYEIFKSCSKFFY